MKRLRTTAGLTAVLVLGAAVSVLPAQDKRIPIRDLLVHVKVSLSTGENISGQCLPGGSRKLVLRVKNRTRVIVPANVIRFSLKFAGQGKAKFADLTGPARDLAFGTELLKRRYAPLAALIFRKVLGEDESLAGEIAATYKKHHVLIPADLGGPKGVKLPKRRYVPATIAQVRACTAKAEQWAKRMKEFAPATHLVNSRFFRIYSAWSKNDDRALAQIYDQLYATLSKQFDIPAGENIWIGKLPVYAFWDKGNYVRFLTMVCKVSEETAKNSGGLSGTRSAGRTPFAFVILGPVKTKGMSRQRAKRWFFELLVHESTHAFLSRYMGPRHIISWVNEGIAETVASTLVRGSYAAQKLKQAYYAVRTRNADFSDMLDMKSIPIDPAHYGAAQGLVRFLIRADHRKFIRFIELLKQGSSGQDALKGAYDGLTYKKLLAAWSKFAARSR